MLYRGPQSFKAAWVGVRACDLGALSELALLQRARRALPCALQDWQKVFRLAVKEVLTCDPKAAADPGLHESA